MSDRPIRPTQTRQQFVAPNFVPGTGNQGWIQPGLNPNQISQGHIPRQRSIQQQIPQQQNHGNLQGIIHGSQKPPPRQPTSHRSSSSKKVRNPLLEKEHRTQSWHDYPKEKRIVHLKKKHAADVFPQHPDQEEDNLTPERIKRGYFAHIWQGENESALPKFMANPNLGEELLTNVVKYIQQIVPTKNDDINSYLEKKRINTIHFQNYGSKSDGPGLNSRVLSWISELKKGKAPTSLVRKVPLYNEFEDGNIPQGSVLLNAGPSRPLELAFEHKIPIPLAVWYLLTHHVGVSFLAQNEKTIINNKQINPPLKKPIEMCDYTIHFVKILKEILDKVDEEPLQKKQKWKYYTFFIRTAVMNGMVDRQEFLTEICDLLFELHQKPTEKMQAFRMLLSFSTMFTSEIIQNIFLSRKYLHLTALRLKAYVDEAEKKKKTKLNPYTVLTDLMSCVHHRSIVLNCIALATAIICDCSTAAVWSPLEEPYVPIHLVGTALEHFPIDPAFFSIFFKYSRNFSKKYRQLMMKKLDEIKQRSFYVDQRWALNDANCTGFQTVMRACVDVIGLLDTADVHNPRSFLSLYAKLYGLTRDNESFEEETVIRTKAMFHWAITQEREGSHRASLVTKILLFHVEHFNSMLFDGKSIVYIMIDFLNKEGPTPDKKGFKTEFSNLMLLLMELQRAKLFHHDEYVSLLMRYNMIDTEKPISLKLKRIMDAKKPPEPKINVPPPASEPEIIELDVDPVVVSFIPPPSELRSAKASEKKDTAPVKLCTLKDSEDNDRPFLETDEEISMHERILAHLPIDQNEENRGLISQRTNILYGIGDERENVRLNLKKFATEIIKIWNRHSIKLYNSRRAVKKKNARKDLNKIFQEFRTFTYYDQLAITGMCSDGYLQLIKAFPRYGDTFPNMECLDMLLAMFEQAQSIAECLSFILELLPHVFNCEEAVDELRTDCAPGFFSSQQCFVIVGFLADHYKFYMLSKFAGSIANGLYRLIEKEVKLAGYPKSCWARTTAAFLAQVRYDLRNYELPNPHGHQIQLSFQTKFLKELLPECGNIGDYTDATYNPLLLTFLINPPRRCICYHDYKDRLPSIDSPSSKYSFILNAFKSGKVLQNDYEKISELSNTCGHVSVEKDLSTEWLTIIEALCSPLSGKRNLPGFNTLEPVEDMKSLFFYSTFITLLASRFCFSTHVLFVRLNNQAVLPYLKSSKTIQMVAENRAHFLLTLQIITNIVTASEEPFQLSKEFFYPDQERTHVLKRPADVRCLRILHIRELDAMILSILTNIFFISDAIKKEESLKEIYKFAFNSVLTMSDQEWVIERIFQICQNDRDIEEFNTGVFGKDSLGQYLLRIALRRKTERETKMEFVNSKGSKKALIDKIFSCLSIWNLRASYCDLKVMIKDTTPGKNSKYHAQTAGIADALMREICRSCRDFFFSSEKLNEIKIPQIALFEFSDLNSYWLMSELMDIISPENVTKTIKALFLDEMIQLVSISQITDGEKIKRMKQSAELLGKQPFINMILTCQNHEERGRENLVNAMLNFCLDLMTKFEKNPELLLVEEYQLERESMLLRINLIGSMIDFNSTSPDIIFGYITILFQLLYNEMITIEKDGKYFYHLYDMLSICIMSYYNGPGILQQTGDSTKPRYPDYYNFVRKFKKEFGDRIFSPKMYLLQQLLPLKATTSEIQNFNDMYVLPSPMKMSNNKSNNGQMIAGFSKNVKALKTDKYSDPPQKRLLRMLHHTHQNEFYHSGTPGMPSTKQQLQTFVIGPPNYIKQQHRPQMMIQNNPMRQQILMQQQQTQLGAMQQQMMNQVPPGWPGPSQGQNPNHFPPGPPSGNYPTNQSMMPPNSGFNPSNQFNPMIHPGQNFMPNPRMGMETQMMRPPVPNISPSTRQIRKRGSNQTMTPPQNARMPKRLKREAEQVQMPQIPGPGQGPPPGYFPPSQPNQQGPPGGPWQQQLQFDRLQVPNQQMLNPSGLEQRPPEAREILKTKLQQKKDKQSQQISGNGQQQMAQQQQIRQHLLQQPFQQFGGQRMPQPMNIPNNQQQYQMQGQRMQQNPQQNFHPQM